MHTSLRSRLAALLLLVTAAGALASAASVSASAAAPPRSGARPASLPSDPKAHGYIGFCDEAGHNVVGGSVSTKPFVWRSVASVAPPSAYQGAGQNAVLNAYQPRPDTAPAYWSGSSLTGASYYSYKPTPTVQATYIDSSLADFVAAYPPQVNGLYVLRIFFGKRNYGLYSATYATTTIQVQGERWHVVSGGTVDCSAAARATSVEQLTGVVSKADVTPRTPARDQATAPAGRAGRRIVSTPASVGAGSRGATTGAAGHAGSAGSASADAAATAPSSSSHSWVLWSLIAVVVLLAAALAGTALRGRRGRLQASGPPDPEDPR